MWNSIIAEMSAQLTRQLEMSTIPTAVAGLFTAKDTSQGKAVFAAASAQQPSHPYNFLQGICPRTLLASLHNGRLRSSSLNSYSNTFLTYANTLRHLCIMAYCMYKYFFLSVGATVRNYKQQLF